MYTKSEIIEMIWRQFPVDLSEKYIEKLLKASDDELKDSMKKACGANLTKIGSKFIINYN
jgi:nucleoid DNA-binding protein